MAAVVAAIRERLLRNSDFKLLLAAKVHLGAKYCDPEMKRYVLTCRKSDGVHIINIQDTMSKLLRVARIIASIPNPKDVILVQTVADGNRAALEFAKLAGVLHVVGPRYVTGTFTKQSRLVISLDPTIDQQAIREAAEAKIPVVAFCDVDSSLSCVDVAIPANNKGKRSISCLLWLLTRIVLQMRGLVSFPQDWGVKVDSFLAEEQK